MSTPTVRPRLQHRSFLAFDFGTHRVGVATGNTLTGRATPLAGIELRGLARMAAIDRLVAEWRPDALVVGVPFHPDGAAHVNTRRARAFARELEARHGLPVHCVDERYTTVEARARGAADLDAGAAAVILEQHLGAPPEPGRPGPPAARVEVARQGRVDPGDAT